MLSDRDFSIARDIVALASGTEVGREMTCEEVAELSRHLNMTVVGGDVFLEPDGGCAACSMFVERAERKLQHIITFSVYGVMRFRVISVPETSAEAQEKRDGTNRFLERYTTQFNDLTMQEELYLTFLTMENGVLAS